MVSRNPKPPLDILLDRGNTIVGQATLNGVYMGLAGLQIVTHQTIVGTYIQHAVKLAGNTRRRTIVQAVLAKRRCPTLFLNIEGTNTHSRSYIDTSAVRRQGHLRDVVIDNSVDIRFDRGLYSHGIGLDLIGSKVNSQQAVAHGSYP